MTTEPTRPVIIRAAILRDIDAERDRQQAKWGTQRHDYTVWLTVLLEECGEIAEALLRLRQAQIDGASAALLRTIAGEMRTEAIQTAAVLVSMVEHIDEEAGPVRTLTFQARQWGSILWTIRRSGDPDLAEWADPERFTNPPVRLPERGPVTLRFRAPQDDRFYAAVRAAAADQGFLDDDGEPR